MYSISIFVHFSLNFTTTLFDNVFYYSDIFMKIINKYAIVKLGNFLIY